MDEIKNIGSISRPDARSYIKFSINCRGDDAAVLHHCELNEEEQT